MKPEHKAVYDFIAANPGCMVADIAKALGLTTVGIRARMEGMKGLDYLLTDGTVRWQRYYVKRLNPEFRQQDAYEQAPSIWRVGARIAAEVRGVDWRAPC